MSITPNNLLLVKEQTFSSVAKEVAHLPIALDDHYPVGGYPISSLILFNDDKYSYRLMNGYALNSAGALMLIFEDVVNHKLRAFYAPSGAEAAHEDDLSDYTAYCSFHRW